MKINYDRKTVSFKTEPEELFEAEKSGAKSNTVRILDAAEADRIKRDPPAKIIIQYDQEIFLRTLTNICEVGDMLGKVIVIFSWKPQPASNETDNLSSDVLTAPSLTDDAFAVVTVSKNLLGLLQSIAHGRSMNSVIQELYEASQYQQFKMEEKGLDPKAHIISPDEGEPPIDLNLTPILIPRSLLSDLNWHRGNDTLPEFISKLLKDRTGGQ